MKKFNINNYIYIQIFKTGWEHLNNTVGEEYIEKCIKTNEELIDGEIWYKLQAHQVFSLLPQVFGAKNLYNSNIMIDDHSLISWEE